MTKELIEALFSLRNPNQELKGWKYRWEAYHPRLNCGGYEYELKDMYSTRHIFKYPQLGLSISIDKNAKEVVIKGLAQSSFDNEEDWKPNEERTQKIESYVSELVNYFFNTRIKVKGRYTLKKVKEDESFYWAYNPRIYKVQTKVGTINFLVTDCNGVLK